MNDISIKEDTIVAPATAAGVGAIAIIRVSGSGTFSIVDEIFFPRSKKKTISEMDSHTIHLGWIKDDDKIIDEVLISIFKNPNSYTGEDVIEISCHGSEFIQQQILQLLIKKGARMARQGEFTLRAFLNGKMDLSQAEAVADIVSGNSESAHRLAMQQMRGGYSEDISKMRNELIHLASLVELELDFSEEDVEFANRE